MAGTPLTSQTVARDAMREQIHHVGVGFACFRLFSDSWNPQHLAVVPGDVSTRVDAADDTMTDWFLDWLENLTTSYGLPSGDR